MDKPELIGWLKETDKARLETLWQMADTVRKENVGEEVHLRGLIEIGNHCIRECGYCGLRAGTPNLERYRLSREEIEGCVRSAVEFGYGTVVMQAGEDYGWRADTLAEIIRWIKQETPLAVTLSLGERPESDLALWREAGADRYLLRFETSDPVLYKRIHPDYNGEMSDRIAILKTLQRLGYEAGSGVMLGIPGQTYASVADDILTFQRLDLDMIGVGPFIAHPATPLGQGDPDWLATVDPAEQVPATELMTYKMVALTRIHCPEANLPSTTALATLNKDSGRENGLMRGANVVMPNLTPTKYRALYEIYPAKVCIDETAADCRMCLRGRILRTGRVVGTGPGFRKKK